MKTLVNLLFITSIILLQSCIQAPSSGRKNSLTSSATTAAPKSGSPSGTLSPSFASDESTYWFTSAKVTGTVTLNKNTQDVLYLRGKLIHDFLNAKDTSGSEYFRKQYCIVGNFSSPSYKQIRVRAIPIYITTATKAIERLFRLDVPTNSDNTSACQFSTINSVLPSSAAFSLPGICSSCSGQITTKDLNLYETKNSSLTKIDDKSLSLSSVLLRVDLSSNSSSPESSCTNSSCSAKGFDCCLSGQCVKDASEKPSASVNPLDPAYIQAKNDYAKNPLSFINYPNVFYICSNIAHTPTPPTSGTGKTPAAEAQDRVTKYLADYTCLSDVKAGLNYDNCRSTNTSHDKRVDAYLAIKKKLAIACGCMASESEMAVKCPDWGILPVYKSGALPSNSNITDFGCYTPQPVNPIGPITNLNVSVSNRSAPHRFYAEADGKNYDSIEGHINEVATLLQEGVAFSYSDEFNKVGPNNSAYNINSVLGSMTVDLNHTLPAKLVNVELGKSYILSATSGYFTPCSQCVKDSWFENFTAHPNSQRGVGLQASGYTTSRDTYSANATFGNYEDTKFGRACYVPVTMLPLSHKKESSLQTQRKNRLTAQAAYYINGHQRDWYGFNKGALIGSFDGVTWFAVGTGRRITATSTKLFLALNASFLDLAAKTDTIVNIIPDFSANTAADYDYDPALTLTDPKQNTGATCQQYHQCSVDADCVAQLGWEYTCADVSQYKTKWPVFNSEGDELANQERSGTLFDILQATISTTVYKRCVYRGQGAPCKASYNTPPNINQKAFACAPNFYCAKLDTSNFNDQVARSPNELDDIFFGMDANVLGRPLHYVMANQKLPESTQTIIKYNATDAIGLTANESSDMGICRPGRSLSGLNDLVNHASADPSKRADYISQIGSCDSTQLGSNRFKTCPAFDDNLNYVEYSASDSLLQKQTQNACGGESKNANDAISAFKSIEGLSLLNSRSITQASLVQDACYRRAGSVCHSDLDCGPNKLHEDSAAAIALKYFGGTEAEQQYWKESLVCGQGSAIPALGTAGYFNYKLSENRCCREIGKDFTMYTSADTTSVVPENSGSNLTLDTKQFTDKNPLANNRYSRYIISKTALADPETAPRVLSTAEPAPNQWKVINETGSLTCCGGGWIRKFTDGSHDWKIKNRLAIDSNNFTCLNYRSPLMNPSYNNFTADKVNPISYQREAEYFCRDISRGGCMQIEFPGDIPQLSSNLTILGPVGHDPAVKFPTLDRPASGSTRLDTTPVKNPFEDTMTTIEQVMNVDAPYQPLPYYYTPIIPGSKPEDTDVNGIAYNFFTNQGTDYGVEMYLPAYIGYDSTIPSNSTFITRVAIRYISSAGVLEYENITGNVATQTQCNDVINISGTATMASPVDGIPESNWCIVKNAKTGQRPVFIARAKTSGNPWLYAGIVIEFKPIEIVNNNNNNIITAKQVAVPGNALYYLTKLARLELIGIPQITYEPLYCNDDQSKVVPGLFKSNYSTRGTFEGAANTYGFVNSHEMYTSNNGVIDSASTAEETRYGNWNNKFVFQDKLDHSAIFSSKDFTCCTPLGKNTTAAGKCCSGYAVGGICKLPKGVDLNVYFNKFVSSEGVGVDQPSGGLLIKGITDAEVDFNPYTGEPKMRSSTYDKLLALGYKYCEGGKIVTGAAFGKFTMEPFSGSYVKLAEGSEGTIEDFFTLSIVNSVLDVQSTDLALGKVPFDNGNRWNHHLYCQ
ncbi:MAG: hypothetical protein KBD76_06240 [Bacteriovorax sp.]|nr:hypothetical protein [Bacteriovorax sp.]